MTTMSEGTTCCLPTLTVPDRFLRAWVVLESAEAHVSEVTLAFSVCQQAHQALDRQFHSMPYRSIRIVLPRAQALSLLAALQETLR